MRYVVQARIRTLLAQQSGHIQLLIFAPILTLFLLSLVVRTANSAIDPTLEKKKVTQQLKQRLIEVRNVEGSQSSLAGRPGGDSQTLARTPKTEESDQSSDREAPTPAIATGQNHEALFLTEERWAEVEGDIHQKLLLLPLPESRASTSSLQETSEKTSSSVPEHNLPAITWQVARNHLGGVSLASAKATTSSKKKAEQVQAGATLRNVEDVKRALASAMQKKPAPVLTAAIAPVPLPAPKLTPKEEPIVSYPEHLSYQVKRNETLEKVLKQVKIAKKEVSQWTTAARKLPEFQKLRPGQVLELSFSQDVENPGLKTISFTPEEELQLILERKTAKQITATRIQPPLQPVWVVLGGRVEKGLSKSLKKTGLPEQLVKGVVNLDWNLDLSDLRKGDSFKILVEAIQRGRKIVEYKTLLAAELLNHGQTFTAFLIPEEQVLLRRKRFEEEYRGQGLNIESEGEKFLRFPLQFSRISSSFSGARFHPILHRTRRHNGIDFAAPRGTPVYSVAKGVVTFIGRQSGYGNLVKVDHPGPYETAYAHLQGFASGIEEGTEIEQGRVLGYVGSTGLATGPHLHFELLKDGLFVNPFTEQAEDDVAEATPEEKPAPADPVIEAKKKSLLEKLATLDLGGKAFTSLVIAQQPGAVATAASDNQEKRSRQASSEEKVQR
jgi:murein DD-endopeptidase MepM/ murein hydrolase activator NlpD